MKVLLIGNGGREHALAWRLADSRGVTALYAMPGNPGTAQVAENVPGNPLDFKAVETFVRKAAIDFVIVGPEDPLAAGLVDRLTAMGVKAFGPTAAGARLESDKWYAKEIMRQQAVPTAEARVFSDAGAAEEFIRVRNMPCVVKAVGLAKGKGVDVCYRPADALDAIDRTLRKKSHGAAGSRIVIEEMLAGPEVSVLALVDGRNIYVLDPCQDHKPIEDGDTGPMTGGMGAYCPTPVVTPAVLATVEREVLVPVVDGLLRDGEKFRGVLYAGLMLTTNGPKVLEFNCRFGDPECQPLMMRLRSDLLELLLATTEGRLDEITVEWDPRPAVCVVAASGGYPGDFESGKVITGIANADALPDVKVFQAGTRKAGGEIVTDGGRVLGVTALGNTVADAQRLAYEAMGKIHFDGIYYRRDIAHQALR